MEFTTSDIRENCEDLKVLGKGDFKALLKWRARLREEVIILFNLNLTMSLINSQLGVDVKEKPTEELTEVVEVTEEVDEEQKIEDEVSKLCYFSCIVLT